MPKILLVDDDAQGLQSTRKILELHGYEVEVAPDGQSALDLVRGSVAQFPNQTAPRIDLVISDVRMPRLGGLEFLKALTLFQYRIPVILMTAYGSVEDAVWAIKTGASDFLTKPFKRQALLSAVDLALKRSRLHLSQDSSSSEPSLIGQSRAMSELKKTICQISGTQVSVLITGQSGTGKELIARSLHAQSPRHSKRMVSLNCAALPEHLMESELFGFEKGSFTGATAAREGLFEAAHEGTLFLDEIGDMPLVLQAKLLRVLQESEVRRIGSTYGKKINVRIIAATHKDLKVMVREGSFRQDLLYRLEVVTLLLPPLIERMEDLPELSAYFLKVASERHEKNVTGFDENFMKVLCGYTWPGNVRELSNVIERAVVFSESETLTADLLPAHLESSSFQISQNSTISVPFGTSLRDVQDLLIQKTLEATDGDKNITAKLLGINSRTIYRKLDRKSGKEFES